MKNTIVAVLSVMAMALGLLICGCETGDGTVALSVSPSSYDFESSTNSGRSVTFTVEGSTTNETSGLRQLSLPLKWTVDNPDLGEINQSGGYTAVYVAYSVGGVNVVRVKDQYDAEGQATVTQ